MDEYHFKQRRAGVLLHLTSLPSHTIEDGYRWLDYLAEAGLGMWQVLPLGIPQSGHSPYQSLSTFAVDPRLFGEIVPATKAELAGEPFRHFCQQQQHWLDSFAYFMLLRGRHKTPWYQWPTPYRTADSQALEQLQTQHSTALLQLKWQQYICYQRWHALRSYAHERNIALFGDMPIFVAHDSADVWAHPQRFLLDERGMPRVVTGVPPDYFSKTGQRWGNPHYNWEQMEAEAFSWWMQRLHFALEWFDLIRIDHFRGLEAAWHIQVEAEHAIEGHWVPAPGEKLLAMLQQEMGEIPLVAEDLGVITHEVRALKQQFELPGMSVLQFGFDHFDDNPHKPKNITPATVVYTGTHDNDTIKGWYQVLTAEAQQHVLHCLGIDSEEQLVQTMIKRAMTSNAALAIIPLQDLLQLGSDARMNVPGTIEGNWRWSFEWAQLNQPGLAARIRGWVVDSNRLITGDTDA